MGIQNEVKDFFDMISQHPDQIDKLNLFVRLKNGTIFNYKMDRRKEDKILLAEQIRKQKFEEKQRKLEEKKQKILEKNNPQRNQN